MEGINKCEQGKEGGTNNDDIIWTKFVNELQNYIHLNMIGNPSCLVLIDSYDLAQRKITSKYIEVDRLSFGVIPKLTHQ